jgi:hypothetical protein
MFPMGRALVDDASTANYTSDGDTFASEGDPLALRHETDPLLLERASEHSRILTDDDGSDAMWVGAAGNLRSLADGASSVNTGSTYDETPFLPSYEKRMVLTRESSWNDADIVIAQSHSADDGYACEMVSETQSMINRAKTNLNHQLCSDGVKQHWNNAVDIVLGGIQVAFGACHDQVDTFLIRIFNVPVTEVETRPSYVVSLDESLTEDLRSFSDALVGNKSKKELDTSRRSRKHSKKGKTLLIPTAMSETTSAHFSLDYSYSEMKDDLLDKVLSDDFDPTDEDKCSLSKKEEEITRTVQSADVTEDLVTQEFNGRPEERSDLHDVPSNNEEMLDKMHSVTESRDDETATLVSIEPEEEEINSNSTKVVNDINPNKTDEAKIDEGDNNDRRDSSTRPKKNIGGYEVDTSFSRMHRQRVVELINKNLQSTNRTEIIDLSHFEADIEDTLASTIDLSRYDAFSNTAVLDPTMTRAGEDKEIDESIRREKYCNLMNRLNRPVFEPTAARLSEHNHTFDKSVDLEVFGKGEHETRAVPVPFAPPPSNKMETAIDLTMFEDFL